MPKRLFIISDMQFNKADDQFVTNFQNIQGKYKQAGYAMPTIVFWNVNGTINDFPVSHEENGTVLVSGFSPSILKDLVQSGDFSNPLTFLRKVLDAERYNVLTLPTEV